MPSPPPSAVLHHCPSTSPSPTAILIDIPLSLSLSQHLLPIASASRLSNPLSSPAPSEPYPSTEPKSVKARQRVLERLGDDGAAAVDEAWVAEGLEGLRKGCGGVWCLGRKVAPGVGGEGGSGGGGRKRKRKWTLGDGDEDGEGKVVGNEGRDRMGTESSEDTVMGLRKGILAEGVQMVPEPCLRFSSICDESWEVAERVSKPMVLPTEEGEDNFEHSYVKEVGNRLICNSTDSAFYLTLHYDTGMDRGSPTYILPPSSSFFLSSIDSTSIKTFSDSAYAMLPKHSKSAGPGQFDFILLDPPWQNRSVRRSKRYETTASHSGRQYEDSDPLIPLEERLGQHIAPDGLVGCWITNKAKAREKALQVFDSWGVELVEEWVWLKVTSKGEPVTELGGVWRKSYELLLLGRKALKDENGQKVKEMGDGEERKVKKTLIVAVPDLHSRKPNLKELVEPMMPHPREYRALEVFARNLTAGWWAWGDECLKYSWTDFWSTDQD